MCVSDLSLCVPLFVFVWSTFAHHTRSSTAVHLWLSPFPTFVLLSLSLSHSLPLFFSQALSLSQASCLQISSINLLLNYSRASVPEECFRLLVEENGLKREKLREWGFRWKEEMSFVTKDVLMRRFMSYRRTKRASLILKSVEENPPNY